MLLSDFRKKDVINICNCKNLGHITDIEFDQCSGQICKIFIGGDGCFRHLFPSDPEYVICYKDIKQIGPDIILVEIC